MSVESVATLLGWLHKHEFLSLAQLEELTASDQALCTEDRDLLRQLLKRGWLTAFQANALLQGKGERLLLGSYRLLDRIGQGAMGEVFKARQIVMDRVVALKLIQRAWLANPNAVDRFRQEVRAAAQLMHPNIVVTHDANQVDGTWYFAMEFVEGADLGKVVAKQGPLPYAHACAYVRQAARGLQHAYEKGVVHRDIKPSNLLLTEAPAGPLVKILDFGLARFGSEVGPDRVPAGPSGVVRGPSPSGRLTQAGVILGTVDYISPEQAEDSSRADIRSDLFSLGCTLYYLLTTEHPYPGQDVVEKIRKRVYGEALPVRNLRTDVPVELERVLMKMLARLPVNRYQTPAEVAAALEPFTRETATPPALVSASQRRLRRPAVADVATATDSRRSHLLRRRKRPRKWQEQLERNWPMVVWFGGAGVSLMLLAMTLSWWLGGRSDAAAEPRPTAASAAEPAPTRATKSLSPKSTGPAPRVR